MFVTDIVSGSKHVRFLQKNNQGGSFSLSPISGSGKSKKSTRFRYFRLKIYDNDEIQFCSLQFYKTEQDIFSYCKGITPTRSNIEQYVSSIVITTGYYKIGDNGSEDMVRGLLPVYESGGKLLSDKKCCIVNIDEYPFILQYDLKSERLDVSKYNKWRIFTANDTDGYSSRNLYRFTVDVTNTPDIESSWITVVNNYDNPQEALTSQNYQKMFDFDLDLTEILT